MTPYAKTQWIATLALALSTAALGTATAIACRSEARSAPEGPETAAMASPSIEPTRAEEGPSRPSTNFAAPSARARAASTRSVQREPARDMAPSSLPGNALASATLNVKRLVVTRGIEDREPLATDSLRAGTPIFAFVEIENDRDADTAIVITFEQARERVGHVELSIPADVQRWRTWGRTALIRQAGTWTAVVRTKDGRELARQNFEVEHV